MSTTLTKKRLDFLSADGKNTVAAYWYHDEQVKPKAVLQISHGMCEYIARYDDFAEYLCWQGYAVFGNDHLGHGATSDGENGIDGYFGEKDGREYVLADLRTMNNIAHEKYPDLPVILFGHSMGSFYARAYAARWGESISGLVICGTGGPNPLAAVGLTLTTLIGKLKGQTYRSKLVNQMAFGAYLKQVPNAKTPYDWISRDEEIVGVYAADAKCTFVFTVSAFHELMAVLKSVSSLDWAKSLPRNLPVLVVAGDADPVGDYGKGVQTVHAWLKEAGIQNLSLKLYPGMRHEILNEIGRKEVYADIKDWLDKII